MRVAASRCAFSHPPVRPRPPPPARRRTAPRRPDSRRAPVVRQGPLAKAVRLCGEDRTAAVTVVLDVHPVDAIVYMD